MATHFGTLAVDTLVTEDYIGGVQPATLPPVSSGTTWKMTVDPGDNLLKISVNGGAWSAIATAASATTLDGAYDFGGAGLGRTVEVDSGAITLNNTAAGANALLALNQPAAALSASLTVSTGVAASDAVTISSSAAAQTGRLLTLTPTLTTAPLLGLNSSDLFSSTGVPGAGIGANGDYYFRDDPVSAATSLYVKVAGAWLAAGGGGGGTLQIAYDAGPAIATSLANGAVAVSKAAAGNWSLMTVTDAFAGANTSDVLTASANALSANTAIIATHAGNGICLEAFSNAGGAALFLGRNTSGNVVTVDAFGEMGILPTAASQTLPALRITTNPAVQVTGAAGLEIVNSAAVDPVNARDEDIYISRQGGGITVTDTGGQKWRWTPAPGTGNVVATAIA